MTSGEKLALFLFTKKGYKPDSSSFGPFTLEFYSQNFNVMLM